MRYSPIIDRYVEEYTTNRYVYKGHAYRHKYFNTTYNNKNVVYEFVELYWLGDNILCEIDICD